MGKKRVAVLMILFLLLITIGGLYRVWVTNNTPNDSMADPFQTKGTRLVIGGEEIKTKAPALYRDSQVLIDFETVKAYIDPYIWWDESLKQITVTTKDRVIRMKTGSLDALINDEPLTLSFSAVEEGGAVYLPLNFLKDFYLINVSYAEDTDCVIIDFKNRIYRTAYPLTSEAVMRRGMHIKDPVVKRFEESSLADPVSELYVFEEYESWYKVRDKSGILGYIAKSQVKLTEMTLTEEFLNNRNVPVLTQGKINLVWDMSYSKKNITFSKSSTPGIDVISPTWFEIVDREGTIKNRATPEYVGWAHENGWQVWALFANDFSDIEGTHILLNDSEKRRQLIRSVLAYAALYRVDGINLDFENIYKEDKDAYTQFVREFTPLAREQGLVVSVDVTIPDGSDTWSKCFDRKALAETVDFVCLMTYDQHWASSPIAGSTAELAWVDKNVEKTLKEVPAQKLLLGIPLYTRLWTEETVEGKSSVSSKALNIVSAWKQVEENEAVLAWNASSGQYQASYEKDGKVYKLWLEDADAVNMKTSLVHKYNLAGASVWAANFADEKVFEVFERNLKQIAHYDEWKSTYEGPAADTSGSN